MPQLFKNNVSGVLASQLLAAGTSMTLVDASAFPDPGADFYLITLIGLNTNAQESSWEIVKVTAKASNTLTVVRAQEGTTAVTWPPATRVEMRLTAGSLDTKEAAITAGTTAQYLRGDKSWRDLFTDVRAATLTGLSTATNAVISAADTVLSALGKLQAQVSAKQDTLVSGTNIKTVNSTSLLGTGNIVTGDATLAGANAFTGANAFRNASGQLFQASTTVAQDGLIVTGRAGGTGTLRVTLAPGALTANRAVTFGNFAGTVVLDSATQTLTNKTISGGVFSGLIDQTGSVRSSITSISTNVDCSLGNYFTVGVTGSTTLTITNAPASKAYAFTLEVTHTSGTLTWPAEVKWPGDVTPSLTAGKTHLFTLVTDDAGLRWRGIPNVDYAN